MSSPKNIDVFTRGKTILERLGLHDFFMNQTFACFSPTWLRRKRARENLIYKKDGNFKINIHLDSVVSFLYCLYSKVTEVCYKVLHFFFW